mmetsp:Transcript_44990/g.97022  ORF Transcript_44990/g.97022 Transcript_44990/m.97022 type:complete len:314 (-) Transcript_44990:68-1009(-)|eukprot:CAMPEP_0206617600 /NCGR_PEP_ID=MMETSP0325_2-20121206/59713_1 /ASSEMBLY_ACC=CAM_ASM_000347 /TAXON_ID=2866 /ORGANISM="Crypthecodinium cohnii, Strain Seligo" /LENGTH=313 /DNA_ID=CAMNT_0054139577 /DNA_START=171 /DNA_END=1112 /DNA_ORIENTATION=-
MFRTKGGLLGEIAECERQLVAVRLKAEEKREVEAKRLQGVLAKGAEMDGAHRDRMSGIIEEFQKGIAGLLNKRDEALKEAKAKEEEARESCRKAHKRADELDAEALIIEAKMKEVNAKLDALEVANEDRFQRIRASTDRAVARKMEEATERVRDAGLYASEVQEMTIRDLADMEAEMKGNLAQSPYKCAQRSRAKELRQVLSALVSPSDPTAPKNLCQQDLVRAKAVILQAWLDDWVNHTHRATPSTAVPLDSPEPPLRPRTPGRPRSVSFARRRMLMDQGDSGSAWWGQAPPYASSPPLEPLSEARPKTAPS